METKQNKVTLNDVQLMWAKLNEPNQRSDNPKYEVELQNLSKENIALLKGLDPSSTPNDGKKRDKAEKGFYCTPKSVRPVPVYDSAPKKMTIEQVATIGNSSVGNVTVHSYAYNANGKSGVALGLDSVQVTTLEVYNDNPYETVKGGHVAPEMHETADDVPF